MAKSKHYVKFVPAVKGFMVLRDERSSDSFAGSCDIVPMFNGKVYKTRKGAQRRLDKYLKEGRRYGN